MRIGIVVDSPCDLPENYLQEHNISILPTTVRMGSAVLADYRNPEAALQFLQTHLAENHDEVKWVKELFPEARSYLDVYDRYGLLGKRSVFGHCLHLDQADRDRFKATDSVMSFCPTSNLFIGSGLFDLQAARSLGISTVTLDRTGTAKRFYEDAGYVSAGDPKKGFGISTCYPMSKQLAP